MSGRRHSIVWGLWLAACFSVSAHRMDEYLQALLVGIGPDSVTLDLALTPGSGMAGPVARLIDADGDLRISGAEGAAYARSLTGDLDLELDGRRVPLPAPEARFADVEGMRDGTGTSRMIWNVAGPAFKPGEHRLTLHNRHLAGASVYLANALQPESPLVSVQGQARNTNQSELTVLFEVRSPAGPADDTGAGKGPGRRWIPYVLVLVVAIFGRRLWLQGSRTA